MRTKVVKWGNSLGLRIPRSFAEEVQVQEGTTVELSLDEGRLVIQRVALPEYSLDQLLAGVTRENRPEEIDTGLPQGKEEW